MLKNHLLKKDLELNTWYEVDQEGRDVAENDDLKNKFSLVDYFVSNIPSFLVLII